MKFGVSPYEIEQELSKRGRGRGGGSETAIIMMSTGPKL